MCETPLQLPESGRAPCAEPSRGRGVGQCRKTTGGLSTVVPEAATSSASRASREDGAGRVSVEWDPRRDERYEKFLQGERLAEAARVDARRLEAAHSWTAPPAPASAYDQLGEKPPEVDWVFRDLWSGIAQVNAQKKSGKTTLLLNAAAALVTNEPFLGRFDVDADSDCRVGYRTWSSPKASSTDGWLTWR